MKITKTKLKQIIKEEIVSFQSEKETKTFETLMEDLQLLLEKWPACTDEPGGMACTYHKQLEELILNYGGKGCPMGGHVGGSDYIDHQNYQIN